VLPGIDEVDTAAIATVLPFYERAQPRGWVTSYAAIATGEMNVVTDNVRVLTGHEPIGVSEFLRRS
jgi:hypothetical protein